MDRFSAAREFDLRVFGDRHMDAQMRAPMIMRIDVGRDLCPDAIRRLRPQTPPSSAIACVALGQRARFSVGCIGPWKASVACPCGVTSRIGSLPGNPAARGIQELGGSASTSAASASASKRIGSFTKGWVRRIALRLSRRDNRNQALQFHPKVKA